MRASGSDKGLSIAPAKKLSLEEYLEWIADSEYSEVTPRCVAGSENTLTSPTAPIVELICAYRE